MNKIPQVCLAALLPLMAGVAAAEVEAPQPVLVPDESPIRYAERAPAEGTPQAAMLNLVLLREKGRAAEAAELISKRCPDWLREAMLEPNGPIKTGTLSYQLREFTPQKALVSVDYNETDGTFHGWTRSVILEDGRWVVR